MQQLKQKACFNSEEETNKKLRKTPSRDQESEDQTTSPPGEYEEHYDTLQSIGKGAFGFVKLARRKLDDNEVRKCY